MHDFFWYTISFKQARRQNSWKCPIVWLTMIGCERWAQVPESVWPYMTIHQFLVTRGEWTLVSSVSPHSHGRNISRVYSGFLETFQNKASLRKSFVIRSKAQSQMLCYPKFHWLSFSGSDRWLISAWGRPIDCDDGLRVSSELQIHFN